MKNKKVFILISILLWTVVFLFFYFRYQKGILLCSYTTENDLYKIHTIYKVHYQKDIVNYLETKEVMESKEADMLNQYRDSLEEMYEKYRSLDYYDNVITMNKEKLTSVTKINYQKVDIKQWVQLDESNQDLMKNSHVSFQKIKKIYRDNGARCRYR